MSARAFTRTLAREPLGSTVRRTVLPSGLRTSLFADSGLFAVYAGCAPSKLEEVLELIQAQVRDVARRGITAAELSRGKGMLKGALVLGLARPMSLAAVGPVSPSIP